MLKKYFILILSTSLLLVFSSCTKYKEETPFFDKLFFEYSYGEKLKLSYKIDKLDNNTFKITERDTFYSSKKHEEEMYVDRYGIVFKSSMKAFESGYSPLWLPVNQLVDGDYINGDAFTVNRKDEWEGWRVLVLKGKFGEIEKYFDLDTGYLVGGQVKGGKIKLIKTNADISIVSE